MILILEAKLIKLTRLIKLRQIKVNFSIDVTDGKTLDTGVAGIFWKLAMVAYEALPILPPPIALPAPSVPAPAPAPAAAPDAHVLDILPAK